MSKLQVRNEAHINAPVENIWSVITDISLLPKMNPVVIKAAGRMDVLGETRTCEVVNQNRKGTLVEKLIELVPNKKTVWAMESDTMGMSKMLHETRFVFHLQGLDAKRTLVVNETYYRPATIIAKVMNRLVLRRMISKAQSQILNNLKQLTENQP